MRIAVIEDNVMLADGIAGAFRDDGHGVDEFHRGYPALEFLQHESADLVILDVNLPDISGYEVVALLCKSGNNTPVLMLTARTESSDIVSGLDAGADDYLTKPFALAELKARGRALLRRAKKDMQKTVTIGQVAFEPGARRLIVNEKPTELRRKKAAAAEILMLPHNQVVSKQKILDYLYGTGADISDSVVEIHPHRLRKHLVDSNLTGLVIPLAVAAVLAAMETFFRAKRISNDLTDKTLLSVMLVVSENGIASGGDLLAENILEVLTQNLGDRFFYHASGPDNAFVSGYTGIPSFPEYISLQNGQPVFYDGRYRDNPVRVAAMRRLISGRDLSGWITVTTWQYVSQRQKLSLNMFLRSLLQLLIMAVGAGVIVWLALSVGLRPLEKLHSSIKRRSLDDLTPIKDTVPAEVRGIVSALNTLFEKVSDANKIHERFVGDAAHHLRNSIAEIKVQSESALSANGEQQMKERIRKVVRTTHNAGKLIELLLVSAKTYAQDPKNIEIFDLSDAANEAVRHTMPVARKKQNLKLQLEEGEFPVRGYALLLREAVSNLIDNTIQHTDEGGTVLLGLEKSSADSAEIYVRDSGEFFDDAVLRELTKPFSNGATGVSSSSIGLSAVSDITKLHQGKLSVRGARTGRGKEIVITLPLAHIDTATQ